MSVLTKYIIYLNFIIISGAISMEIPGVLKPLNLIPISRQMAKITKVLNFQTGGGGEGVAISPEPRLSSRIAPTTMLYLREQLRVYILQHLL